MPTWRQRASRCFHLSWRVAIWCASVCVYMWVSANKGSSLALHLHPSPPPPHPFPNLNHFCFITVSPHNELPKQKCVTWWWNSSDLIHNYVRTQMCFSSAYTHTDKWTVLLTVAGIPCPSMSHRALLLGALCPVSHVFHLNNRANCLCGLVAVEAACVSGCRKKRELKTFGEWMQAAANPVLE